MSFKERLLEVKERISLSLSILSGHWRETGYEGSSDQDAENPWLEAEHRRCDTRASIDRQVGHLWDAHYEPPRVEELLRKHTLRTKQTTGMEEKARRRSERNSLIKRLSEYEGYRRVIVPFLSSLETDAFYKLRHPEEKNQAVDRGERGNSVDWYIGKQNGRLEIIEDLRLMVTTALAELQMDKAREEAKKQKGGQHDTSDAQS